MELVVGRFLLGSILIGLVLSESIVNDVTEKVYLQPDTKGSTIGSTSSPHPLTDTTSAEVSKKPQIQITTEKTIADPEPITESYIKTRTFSRQDVAQNNNDRELIYINEPTGHNHHHHEDYQNHLYYPHQDYHHPLPPHHHHHQPPPHYHPPPPHHHFPESYPPYYPTSYYRQIYAQPYPYYPPPTYYSAPIKPPPTVIQATQSMRSTIQNKPTDLFNQGTDYLWNLFGGKKLSEALQGVVVINTKPELNSGSATMRFVPNTFIHNGKNTVQSDCDTNYEK